MFYYSLVYDDNQRSLIADKGEIRIGEKYQAKCPPMFKTDEERAAYEEQVNERQWETMIWDPTLAAEKEITEREVDQYLIMARCVVVLFFL